MAYTVLKTDGSGVQYATLSTTGDAYASVRDFKKYKVKVVISGTASVDILGRVVPEQGGLSDTFVTRLSSVFTSTDELFADNYGDQQIKISATISSGTVKIFVSDEGE